MDLSGGKSGSKLSHRPTAASSPAISTSSSFSSPAAKKQQHQYHTPQNSKTSASPMFGGGGGGGPGAIFRSGGAQNDNYHRHRKLSDDSDGIFNTNSNNDDRDDHDDPLLGTASRSLRGTSSTRTNGGGVGVGSRTRMSINAASPDGLASSTSGMRSRPATAATSLSMGNGVGASASGGGAGNGSFGMDLPNGAAASSDFYDSHRKFHRPSPGARLLPCCSFELLGITLLAFVFFGALYFGFEAYEFKHDAQIREELRRMEVDPLSEDMEKKVQALEKDNKYLHELLVEAEGQKSLAEEQKASSASEIEKVKGDFQKDVDKLTKYKIKMHEAIQTLSKKRVLEKYGPGPFQVEVQLAVHPESNVYEGSNHDKDDADDTPSFVVELAPLDLMPHAVFWFLEQVDNGLYDGTSFHRNAGHVVQGGPAPNFLSPPNPRLYKGFRDTGYEAIMFQEYSPKFTHRRYTMGYAGRPSGPDFYVNMKDNVRNHGPGGQTSYEDPTEADPCFAEVVRGTDVLDRIHKSEVQPGAYKRMKHYVAITSMILLTPLAGTDQQAKQNQQQRKLEEQRQPDNNNNNSHGENHQPQAQSEPQQPQQGGEAESLR